MKKMQFRNWIIPALTIWAAPAGAALIVGVNNYSVAPGTPLIATLSVSNSTAASLSDIEGMTLTVQVAAGTGTAPKITSVDALTGTIWSGHVSPADVFTPTGGNQPQYQSRDILTDAPGDFVDANGLLATVTFDTTGAAPGDYAIELIGTKTAGRDSAFLDGLGGTVPATIGEGKITIAIPEPSSIFMTWLVAAPLLLARRRTRA